MNVVVGESGGDVGGMAAVAVFQRDAALGVAVDRVVVFQHRHGAGGDRGDFQTVAEIVERQVVAIDHVEIAGGGALDVDAIMGRRAEAVMAAAVVLDRHLAEGVGDVDAVIGVVAHIDVADMCAGDAVAANAVAHCANDIETDQGIVAGQGDGVAQRAGIVDVAGIGRRIDVGDGGPAARQMEPYRRAGEVEHAERTLADQVLVVLELHALVIEMSGAVALVQNDDVAGVRTAAVEIGQLVVAAFIRAGATGRCGVVDMDERHGLAIGAGQDALALGDALVDHHQFLALGELDQPGQHILGARIGAARRLRRRGEMQSSPRHHAGIELGVDAGMGAERQVAGRREFDAPAHAVGIFAVASIEMEAAKRQVSVLGIGAEHIQR